MMRGPDPPYIDDTDDSCLEDYVWYTVIAYTLLMILGFYTVIWG